jgi:hypothetical protein
MYIELEALHDLVHIPHDIGVRRLGGFTFRMEEEYTCGDDGEMLVQRRPAPAFHQIALYGKRGHFL